MVGLLSGMDNEDRTVCSGDKVGEDEAVSQNDSNAAKTAPDDNQPSVADSDTVDEVERVKELKSILKQRGQYTFRKVKVDFDLIPKKIPYDENDYTVDIQIVEKEPVKIKSWAAIFAAKKAEEEAEAAAIAEAEEALKKAEEVKKREAMKKAKKAKVVGEGQAESDKEESIGSLPGGESLSQDATQSESTANQDRLQSDLIKELNTHGLGKAPNELPSNELVQPSGAETSEPLSEFKLAEHILEEVLADLPEDVLIQKIMSKKCVDSERTDEDEASESAAAVHSSSLQDEQTKDDVEDISTHEDVSDSQLLEMPKSDCEDVSESDFANSLSVIPPEGKKFPKKVLVTAASLVEDILSEVPVVLQTEPDSCTSEPLNNVINKSLRKADTDLIYHPENQRKDSETQLESCAQKKKQQFQRPSDKTIFEHVKRSLEIAAPEIVETALNVVEEIEKIVVDKVGPAIP